MSFPEIIFGVCPVCGGRGGEAGSDSSADASNTSDGNGLELEYYRGDLMCKMCKDRLIADEESIKEADKHAKEDEFRANAGFKRTVN